MGESTSTDSSLRKLIIAKTDHQWVSSLIKTENTQTKGVDTTGFTVDYDSSESMKAELYSEENEISQENEYDHDPLSDDKPKKLETIEGRAARLAKMSAYAAKRLASETPQQRAQRLKRMSEYAAKRLASETSEQRARRLARMSAYAARRLASETPAKRQQRLARMSAYAAKRHAMKKNTNTNRGNSSTSDSEGTDNLSQLSNSQS